MTYVEGKEITKNQRKVKEQKAKKKESSNASTKEATTTKSLHYPKAKKEKSKANLKYSYQFSTLFPISI